LASPYNKVQLGEIGDQVYYTGGKILNNDTDKCTEDLMHKYLKIGSLYTISGINNHLSIYCDHYMFTEGSTGGYCFPCNHFSLLAPKDYLRKKYNLK